MRIALVHDYIKEYGGAERVLEALHGIWPDAPIFTTVYLPEFLGPHKERFRDWDIRTSFMQYLPLKAKLISPFRLVAPLVFKTFDFSQFDVVIVSATGAYVKKFKVQNSKFKIITYCHTPARYLYGFATAREWKKNILIRVLGEIANHFLRLIDFKSSQNVDYFIANSKNVAERIKKFYRKDSTVIYPPVDMKDTKILRYKDIKKGNYFLAGGRLARPKHIDLIVDACHKLNIPLKVFGRGFGDADIKDQISKIKNTNKKSNIEYLGEVTDEEKLELMRNARAYIFAAEDEDFGITPVEAISVGTPVIAYKSGGVVESVIEGKTGLFFDELTVENLSKAMKQFNNLTINSTDCINQAQKFSKERFKKEIKEFVESKIKHDS
ncbi:MAG: hypothetical protein A3D74_02085 [Candidatus Levybacteria bacterium RIFCSPHIGHO2_02_FULL_37_13]|nr:MAG: hypothetical protein A3D74_02085 [Candidatus Levybacteria bacterium RIFCSPHIGHO2_02_FULL_37_13]OGH30720.1 MAG: hypothetical protein A3E40_02450 [Candidatus Levybacteria bacterium RIFCSPHIGHO2_12_FULL_37_9]OGH38343.1 MAG: hypothetical protein A3B41_02065 [Candidatus Levybacteria bacterium RIFCSPLOWO2_01_FULL_37_26]